MKRMDSDMMGIIMALLTFLIPAISALLEKNRKKKGKAVQDVQDSQEENEEESPFFDLKAIFDEVTEELAQEEESSVNEEYETAREQQVQPVLQVQEPEPVEYEELVEEAVPVTADVPVREVPGSVVPEGEKPKNKILQRLKENPADMVLFAEIMNPKYKEL